MYQIDSNAQNTSSTLPTPAAAGTPGYFSDQTSPGTQVDADFMNMIMLELINAVEAAGLTPSKTTFNQVAQAMAILASTGRYAADGGVANALSVTLVSAPSAYVAGFWCLVKAGASNTGTATFAANALGSTPIKVGSAALVTGNIIAGQVYLLVHDGTQMQLVNPSPGTASIGANGYFPLPGGGLEQYGSVTMTATGGSYIIQAITFPVPFPTACYNVTGNSNSNNNSTPASNSNNISAIFYGFTRYGCYVRTDSEQGGNQPTNTVWWRAIGA